MILWLTMILQHLRRLQALSFVPCQQCPLACSKAYSLTPSLESVTTDFATTCLGNISGKLSLDRTQFKRKYFPVLFISSVRQIMIDTSSLILWHWLNYKCPAIQILHIDMLDVRFHLILSFLQCSTAPQEIVVFLMQIYYNMLNYVFQDNCIGDPCKCFAVLKKALSYFSTLL